jgi:hypothetical protein
MRTVTVVLSAGVIALAGCSGDPDGDPPRPSGSGAGQTASGGAPQRPYYSGPALPGLSREPLWSVPHETADRDPLWADLDDAIVLARAADETVPSPPGRAGPNTTSPPAVLEFRDIASGRVRATVRTPFEGMRRDDWGGRLVLVVEHRLLRPANGLEKEQLLRVITGYDSTGSKLGQYQQEESLENPVTEYGGRVLRRIDGPGSIKHNLEVRPVIGGRRVELECTAPLCTYNVLDGATVSNDEASAPAAVGNLLFSLEKAPYPLAVRLVALDAATGRRLWTSATIPAPRGARTEADPDTHLRVQPLTTTGGRLVLAWAAAARFGSVIVTLHDPSTGRLLATGPTMRSKPVVLTNPAGTIAVLGSGGSDDDIASAAWDLSTGRVLWTQGPDERRLGAFSVVNDVLYGGAFTSGGNDDTDILAVDLRTKKVLGPPLALTSGDVPTGNATGHGIMLWTHNLYVFGPA